MNFIFGLLGESTLSMMSNSDGLSFPNNVVKDVVNSAIGKIPGANDLLDKLQVPGSVVNDVLNGLIPHTYNDSGTLQFSFG